MRNFATSYIHHSSKQTQTHIFMKKLVLFMVSALALVFIGQDAFAQSYEPVCIGREQDGTLTLRVWGEGRNRSDAKEQARKNAVYEVLFNGVLKGNDGYNMRPIVAEVNARERYRDYFDIFFMDGGEYLKYVSLADKRFGSTKKIKGTNQVRYCMTIRVLIPELRTRMKEDGILKN